MGTLALVIVVAAVAAWCGYRVGRPTPRPARRLFIAGFLCGTLAGTVLRGRHRRLAQRAMRRMLPPSFSAARRRGRSRTQKVGLAVR
ncbi:hypothetical protein L2K20_19010 [Mycobacterium sp. MBM]|nr:hypothetical protein [Mycobacterium sp. MBM]